MGWVFLLIVLAVLAIAAVVVVQSRRARTGTVPTAIQSRAPRAEGDDFNPELPSGGARVVHRERVAPTVGTASMPPAAGRPDVPADPVVEQVDMFSGVEIPAAQPGPAREIRDAGELPRRGQGNDRARKPSPSDARPKDSARQATDRPRRASPEEVFVVHVMGGGEQRLAGNTLMQSVIDCGLRWGEYGIFHRYEGTSADAIAMFSMANAVEPGTFDIDAMESQSFVGVSFFLMLPGPSNSRQALDMMVEAARRVARDTGGELRDEHHSALTQQTIEHLRQRLSEHERRRLAQQLQNG